MNTTRYIGVIFALLFGFLTPVLLHAEDESPEFDFQEGPGWKEDAIHLPAYPLASDLVAVPLQRPHFPFQLYIDGRHLSVGQDLVSRYIAVLESSSGARNVFFDGIRCASSEYRTYAVGVEKAFNRITNQDDWRVIQPRGVDQFRYVLMNEVLCDNSKRPFPVDEVLTSLREGASLDGDY